MFKRFEQLFGVDLGTCNTLIYQQGVGIVLREPSVVAIHKETGQIEAFGEQAYAMIGTLLRRPHRDGWIDARRAQRRDPARDESDGCHQHRRIRMDGGGR